MTYRANYKLAAFVKKIQKLILANLFSTFLFVILPCSFAIVAADNFEHKKFWLFEAGIIVINTVTFLGLCRKGKVINRTVQAIEIDHNALTLKTFEVRIFKFVLFKSEKKRMLLSDITILNDIFPLKDKEYLNDCKCCLLKEGNNVFYFLSDFFEHDVVNMVTRK
ncbi:hypothetical protein HYN56_19740 [Flavobacterium crocinum]|uniref:Uncharacterized protein n=1 Tax=Flavobacterium crocinum TaxID=2183896 RepID=A0A2S1YQK0_9FLAO|nr:hypothetical protein [Flavobacterium crocinum]AWK06336.1 hypothetical protein HYN56_19740 [Flavobacterium crocinum]